MAHKIDLSTGKPALVMFQQPAWHGLGKVFTTEISRTEAENEGGLTFQVEKAPNIHTIPGIDPIVSKDSFFTYRTDTNAILGTRLGRDYTVYQNHEALDVIDELLKNGNLKIETAGAVDQGKRVFICLKMANPIIVGGNDEVSQYVLLANSHDGSLAITAMPTNVRVVCWNTLSAALGAAKPQHKIRHTTNAADRVKEAFKIMGLLQENSKLNSAAYNAMREHKISNTDFFDYIGNILMTPEEIVNLQKGAKDVLSTRKQNIVKEVLEYAEIGQGQAEALGNGNLNYWWAYNAVTGYLTSKKYNTADDRFNSLMFGDSAAKIKTAANLALKPDTIKPVRMVASQQNFFLS